MSMQNYAQFDSRVAEKAMDNQGFGISDDFSGIHGGNSSIGVGDMVIDFAVPVVGTLLMLSFIGYVVYLLVLGIRQGGDKVISSIQGIWMSICANIVTVCKWIASWKIFHLFDRTLYNWIMWIAIVVIYSLGSSILSGNSSLLKIDRIPEGMVGVDLRHESIIEPGYHVYSPIYSHYFLSPTNIFDFEIVEATANTSEELAVALDRRVGFEFLDEKRLAFYKQYGSKDIRSVSSDIVMPILLESIKKIVYQYSFRDLLTQSDNIKKQVSDLAKQRLAEKGIELQYLNIIDIRLPKSYLQSKEELLKAENERKLAEAALETQKKQNEKRLLEAESEKKVKIIQAEAIAEYNRIVSEQNISQSLLEMRKIDTEEKRIEKRDGKMPQTVNGNITW